MSKFKYIDDLETMKSLNIKDVMLATGLWELKNNRMKHNEHKKKEKPTTNVFETTNTCTCKDCGFHAQSPIDVAKHYKSGNFPEALKWLAETFGINKIPNPEYIPTVKEKSDWEKEVNSFTQKDLKVPVVEIIKQNYSFKYDTFDVSKTRDADLEKGYKAYKQLSYANRLMIIYTDIYNFSMRQNQTAKMEFFKKRKVNVEHKELKKLGYISAEQILVLNSYLKSRYPLEDLVEVRVFNDFEHNHPNIINIRYIKRGGLIAYPSFHKYQTNLVTGFMFRPTQPEKWMIESHMKEIQMSANDIYETLPYGFTNSFITSENAVKCIVEGGPDAHCCPEKINGKELLFIASPGAGNLKEKQLGLLKGQTLRFMLDPDFAGQKGIFGRVVIKEDLIKEHEFLRNIKGLKDYEEKKKELREQDISFYETKHDGMVHKCHKAGINIEVASWDENYGDLNDVKKSIENNHTPFKSMEQFLTQYVTIKKIAIL